MPAADQDALGEEMKVDGLEDEGNGDKGPED
jgi:hypothetical protein